MIRLRSHLLPLLILLSASLTAQADQAESLILEIVDQQGQAVTDAVIEWPNASPPAPPEGQEGTAAPAIMDQINRQFQPGTLAIPAGTLVNFPNRDNIRHHVYSFSPAKIFELKLYADNPGAPVLFDQPGVVVLGCNIHDSMIGYIYVAAGTAFRQTNQAGLAFLPAELVDWGKADDVTLTVWHPLLSPDASKRLTIPWSELTPLAEQHFRLNLPVELPSETAAPEPDQPRNRFERFSP